MNLSGAHGPDFNFMATGIGSVPYTDISGTCRKILEHLPEIPFWPQLVKRTWLEDMNVQVAEGLPMLKTDTGRHCIVVDTADSEKQFVAFYEHYLADDLDYFAIGKDRAAGLYEMTALLVKEPPGPFVKGHSVGPVTFASSISDPDGRPALHSPDLLEAIVKGLAIKALWQVRKLSTTGRKVIIFLDEPGLTGFGSAFSAIQRHQVIALLKEVIDYLRQRSDALVGIHCCGNTDWSMLLESGPDIINFDAFGYMDYFLLYSAEITRFIEQGGTVAWGIVPTSDRIQEETVEGLATRLTDGLNRVYGWGLDPALVRARSLLTPSCGMGSLLPGSTDRVLGLLSSLSARFASL